MHVMCKRWDMRDKRKPQLMHTAAGHCLCYLKISSLLMKVSHFPYFTNA